MFHHVSCVFSQKKDPVRVQIGFFVVRGDYKMTKSFWDMSSIVKKNTSRAKTCLDAIDHKESKVLVTQLERL